ncbi:MAG: hypothetical protein Q9162_005973 [Coniocarpon cinnabarinum]
MWSDTYDSKDWNRLKQILGPAIRLDFRDLRGPLQENLSPDQYVAIIANKKVIGDPRVKTQHLIGGGHWSTPGDGTVQVWWQLRVAHQRFASEDMAKTINKGHAHGYNQQTYQKINGAWKIVGIKVKVDWVEGDLFGTLNPPDEHNNTFNAQG